MVWSYHKDDLSKIHCQTPDNTAIEKNLYAVDGIDVNVFEDFLSDQIESPAVNALKELQKGQLPSNNDRLVLAKFFGFMLVRTPSYKASNEQPFERESNMLLKLYVQHKECFQNWCNKYEGINNQPIAKDIERLRQEILNGKYILKPHHNFSLNTIGKLGLSIDSYLLNMKWIMIKAPKGYFFLTSDNPVIITNPECNGFYSTGLGQENTRVFIPISKEIGLLMVNLDIDGFDNQSIDNNSEIVGHMNKAIILFASKFIFSHKKNDDITQLIKKVTENKN
jgi:hypothetical protein